MRESRYHLALSIVFSFLLATLGRKEAEALVPPPVGVAYYALQAFSTSQCAKALSVFNGVQTPSLAILWGTFGTSNACLKRYLSTYSNVPHVLEVHITNNTCMREGICRRGEVVRGVSWRRYNRLLEERDPTTIRLLKSRIYSIARTVRSLRGPGTRVLLSSGLEDNYTRAAYETVRSLLSSALTITPFEIVRNPMRVRPSTTPVADLLEGHRLHPNIGTQWDSRCVVNNDGVSIQFNSSPRRGEIYWTRLPSFIDPYRSRGCLVYLWWAGPQGLGESRITPGRRRYILSTDALQKINQTLLAYP